jgi:hypothetical protein
MEEHGSRSTHSKDWRNYASSLIVDFFLVVLPMLSCLSGLNRYLISDQRGANIISLNKEGIFSLFGYWGLYLVSVNLGYHLFFLKKPISSRVASIGGKSSIAIEVWLLDGFLW